METLVLALRGKEKNILAEITALITSKDVNDSTKIHLRILFKGVKKRKLKVETGNLCSELLKRKKCSYELIKMLIEAGMDPNVFVRGQNGKFTPLFVEALYHKNYLLSKYMTLLPHIKMSKEILDSVVEISTSRGLPIEEIQIPDGLDWQKHFSDSILRDLQLELCSKTLL